MASVSMCLIDGMAHAIRAHVRMCVRVRALIVSECVRAILRVVARAHNPEQYQRLSEAERERVQCSMRPPGRAGKGP